MVIYYILRADYLSHVMERLKARPESWQALEVRGWAGEKRALPMPKKRFFMCELHDFFFL